MASASLLKLLDSVTAVMDDVALLTKAATKQTAGVVGDDLALNVEQCSGANITADRELPIVFGVMRGSFINKLILIPMALLISFYAPFLIGILLLIGGVYLSFEGGEKILERFFEKGDGEEKKEMLDSAEVWEKKRIKGAIRTDFVLSTEIIMIALGTVSTSPFVEQVFVMSLVGCLMTIGVYGFVAIIVKLDNLGLYIVEHSSNTIMVKIGTFLVSSAPKLMKLLTIIGTVAMFVVGGELIRHNIEALVVLEHLTDGTGCLKYTLDTLLSGVFGLTVGCSVFSIFQLFKK